MKLRLSRRSLYPSVLLFASVAATGCHPNSDASAAAATNAAGTTSKPVGGSVSAGTNSLDGSVQADQAAAVERAKAKRQKAAGTAP